MLRDWYQDQGLSMRAIAERLGGSQDVVRSRLGVYGITRKPHGVPGPDANVLRQMYLGERASVGEIARHTKGYRPETKPVKNRRDSTCEPLMPVISPPRV